MDLTKLAMWMTDYVADSCLEKKIYNDAYMSEPSVVRPACIVAEKKTYGREYIVGKFVSMDA